MRAVNTLRLANTEVFFGPGPKQLLEKIKELSSLRKATIETGISYTKALRLLKRMEQELGFAVVESAKGGNERGGTRLTKRGQQLLDAYTSVETELEAISQQLVQEKFAFIDSSQR